MNTQDDDRPLEPITGRPTTFAFLSLASLPIIVAVFIIVESAELIYLPDLEPAIARGLHFSRGVVLSWIFAVLAAAAINKNWSRAVERIRAAESKTRAAVRGKMHRERLASIGTLAAGVAHEVGNPLASISAIVQLMLRKGPDNKYPERLRTIKTQVDRIEKIIRHLLNFSKPPSVENSVIDISALFDDVVGPLSYSPRGSSVVIRRIVDPDALQFQGSRASLEQILLNLVLNAVDASSGSGVVEICGRKSDSGGITISVRDYGPGIPEEIHDRIFDPFFTTKESGSGLGLAVTKSLVKEMKGSIQISSPPGGGTEFSIILPGQ